jgi:hypothetical protein
MGSDMAFFSDLLSCIEIVESRVFHCGVIARLKE